MGPVENAERGRRDSHTAPWECPWVLECGVVGRVAAALRRRRGRRDAVRGVLESASAGAGVRLPLDDVLRLRVGVQAATGFAYTAPLLQRCPERPGAVAAAADAAAPAVPRG